MEQVFTIPEWSTSLRILTPLFASQIAAVDNVNENHHVNENENDNVNVNDNVTVSEKDKVNENNNVNESTNSCYECKS